MHKAMIISKIEAENFIYFNLHAEEVITSNFLFEDNNEGIAIDRLQIITIERLLTSLEQNPPEIKKLVFDFKHINACQQNLNKYIIKLKDQNFDIIFINLRKTLCEELAFINIKNSKNDLRGDFYKKFCFFENTNDPFTDVIIEPGQLFKKIFKEKIKNYIEPHTKPHTSSFIYLTSYVDMKKFMSHEKMLLLFSLYKLALKVNNNWKREMELKPILICQSINSSFIVSILSTLLKLDILILDKIGPINKLYNRIDRNISEKRKYIVVSDLVCLGTEVKIVKNLIEFIGGKYLGNVSIIKTETLKKSDIKKENATVAVFSITRENNKELGYHITTDLEPFTL